MRDPWHSTGARWHSAAAEAGLYQPHLCKCHSPCRNTKSGGKGVMPSEIDQQSDSMFPQLGRAHRTSWIG